MARASEDSYGTYGGVQEAPSFRGAGQPNQTRANAQEFGGQVGAGIEKLANAGEETAEKYGGMVNETLMTNADSNFAIQVGKIKGDYTSLTGMAAFNAFPKYQQNIQEAFQNTRKDLPLNAQIGFDKLAARTMANHIADGSTYASSQLKEANRDSYSSLANINLQQLLDPDIAKDPERSQYHLDSLKYAAAAQIDHEGPGIKSDSDTGEISFDEDSIHGKAAKADYEQKLDHYLTQGYVNRFDTLAKQDVFGAYKEYQEQRGDMSRGAQIALDSSFAPRLLAAHSNIATNHTLNEAAGDHWKALTEPSSKYSSSNNLGNVKTLEGAADNTRSFVNPATPVDGAILTANTLRKGYQGLTLSEIGQKWAPSSENNTNNWVKNVSAASGIAADAKPDLNDPTQLQALLRGIATAEKSPADRKLFTDDVISQGVTASLAGAKHNTTNQPEKTYATNENGAPLSIADYYRTHSQDVLARGDAYAEQQMPGDLALKRSVRESLNNYMSKTIANENAVHTQDNRNVLRAINGDFTKGKTPQTEDELRAIPGMNNLLDKVAAQDPKFLESVPTLIAKVAQRNKATNSENGFNVITSALENADGFSRDERVNHLARGLGTTNPGIAISYKDFNDAKNGMDLDPVLKNSLLTNMQTISKANGNVDGQGEQRAVKWYSQVMNEWHDNVTQGEKALSAREFKSKYIDEVNAEHTPSKMQQLENWAKNLFTSKQTVPQQAIDMLKNNPSLAPEFKAKYGVDPQQYLGQ